MQRSRPHSAEALIVAELDATAHAMRSCRRCPRLADHIDTQRVREPLWHNAPVPPWGSRDSPLLIVGLAPGRRGANRTGLPFWGDSSGDLLMQALETHGALQIRGGQPRLRGVRLVNAVACLPPGNRPKAIEIQTCREAWLERELAPKRTILSLGRVAHESVRKGLAHSPSQMPFAHRAIAKLSGRTLLTSFHPSPLNTRTGRLGPDAFIALISDAIQMADSSRSG